MIKAKSRTNRPKRIAWGESADVLRLPKRLRRFGASVVRIERRYRGKQANISPESARSRYYPMKLAALLFPENVIELRGLQVSKKTPKGLVQIAPRYYSPYYPVPPKARKEISQMRDKIRLAHEGKVEWEKMEKEIDVFDSRMREMFPDLIPAARKIEAAGFIVPHPEINFTVRNGKIMFYEVELKTGGEKETRGGEMSKKPIDAAVSMAKKMQKEEARRFSADAIKLCCKCNSEYGNSISGSLYSFLTRASDELFSGGIISKREWREWSEAFGKLYLSKSKAEAEEAIKRIRLIPEPS